MVRRLTAVRRQRVRSTTTRLRTRPAAPSAHADIYSWKTGEVIPGTEGIEPGPDLKLEFWNTDENNLQYADFSGGLDLGGSSFEFSWLDDAT